MRSPRRFAPRDDILRGSSTRSAPSQREPLSNRTENSDLSKRFIAGADIIRTCHYRTSRLALENSDFNLHPYLSHFPVTPVVSRINNRHSFSIFAQLSIDNMWQIPYNYINYMFRIFRLSQLICMHTSRLRCKL